VLRHSFLFLWRDTATPEQKLTAKKGLAYLSYGCPSARFVDFGTDLHGGSELLLKVKPWKRTPLWHARTSGPLVNFDMALHVDFDDEDGLDAYSKCPAHQEVSVYNESVCRDEWTARVDWWYGGHLGSSEARFATLPCTCGVMMSIKPTRVTCARRSIR
jgi:hypothetical protein